MHANFFNKQNNRGRGGSGHGRGGGIPFLPPKGRYSFPQNNSNDRSDYATQFSNRRSGVALNTEVITMRPLVSPPRYNKVTPVENKSIVPPNKFDSSWGLAYFNQQQKDKFTKHDSNEKLIKDGPNLSKSISEDYDPFGDDDAYDRFRGNDNSNDKVPPWKCTSPIKTSARDDINPIERRTDSRKSPSRDDKYDPARPSWDEDISPRGGGNYNRGGHDRGSSNFGENDWNRNAKMSKPLGGFNKLNSRDALDCDDWNSKEGNYRDGIKNDDFRQNQSFVKSNSFTVKDMYGEDERSRYSDHSFKRDEPVSNRFGNTTERGFRDQREFGESMSFNREVRFNRSDPLQDKFDRIEPQVDLFRNKHHLDTINRDEPHQNRFNKYQPLSDRFDTRESELGRFDRNEPDIFNRNEPQHYRLERNEHHQDRFSDGQFGRYEPTSDLLNRSDSSDCYNPNKPNNRFIRSSPERDRYERNYDKKRDFSSAFSREDPWEDEENFSRNKHVSFNKEREFGKNDLFERDNRNDFPRERFGGDVEKRNRQEESIQRDRNQEERYQGKNNQRERFQNRSRDRNQQERFENKGHERNDRQERFPNKSQERYSRQDRFRSNSRERNNQQLRIQNKTPDRNNQQERFSGRSRQEERLRGRDDHDGDRFDRSADRPPNKRFKKWSPPPKQHQVRFSPPRRRSPEPRGTPHQPKFSPPKPSLKKPPLKRDHPNLRRMVQQLNNSCLPQPNKTIGWGKQNLIINLPKGQWPLRVQKAKLYMEQCFNPRLIPPNPAIASVIKDLFQRIKIIPVDPQAEVATNLLITHTEFPNKILNLAQKEELKNIMNTALLDAPKGTQIRALLKRPVGILVKPKTDSFKDWAETFLNELKFEIPLKIIYASEEGKYRRLVVQLSEDPDGEDVLKVIEAENDLKAAMWGFSFKVTTDIGANFYYDVPASIFKLLMGPDGTKKLKYKDKWVSVLFPLNNKTKKILKC